MQVFLSIEFFLNTLLAADFLADEFSHRLNDKKTPLIKLDEIVF